MKKRVAMKRIVSTLLCLGMVLSLSMTTFAAEPNGISHRGQFVINEYEALTLSYNIGFAVSVPGGAAGSVSFTVTTAYAGHDTGSHRW